MTDPTYIDMALHYPEVGTVYWCRETHVNFVVTGLRRSEDQLEVWPVLRGYTTWLVTPFVQDCILGRVIRESDTDRCNRTLQAALDAGFVYNRTLRGPDPHPLYPPRE